MSVLAEVKSSEIVEESTILRIRELARQGMRQGTIRRILKMSKEEWAGSPRLAEVWEEGIEDGRSELIRFMREKMFNNNSETAAQWLAKEVYQMREGEREDKPHIYIQINNALSPQEYAQQSIEWSEA